MGETQHSRMYAIPTHLTTFNAGRLVPIYCKEVLPDENLDIDMDFVVRQTTLLTPTMGNMEVCFYSFFVPNRIVNKSWKAVEGENFSGSWAPPSVSLVPLKNTTSGTTQVSLGSVADYYGFPTQQPIPNSVLALCNDLKFRGYVFIYNEFFRDQNYQPPIPISYLNVYQGFFDNSSSISYTPGAPVATNTIPSGDVGAPSIAHELFGSGRLASGSLNISADASMHFRPYQEPPLKVNKLHDYFTSVLPSPQKSLQNVMIPSTGNINFSVPVTTGQDMFISGSSVVPLRLRTASSQSTPSGTYPLLFDAIASGSTASGPVRFSSTGAAAGSDGVVPLNLYAVGSNIPLEAAGIDISDLRMASAIQQYYEILARGGSRYREIVRSFFGIEVDDPYDDVPKCIGKVCRSLDLYQTAQTSSSSEGSTPQGNLAAFGYTSDSHVKLFTHPMKFIEHGYVHIFAVVRHRNIYPSYLSRDNFRLNGLDFYTPPFANISEQPVYSREINPFVGSTSVFGYQEPWAEYRFEPDYVSGYMRPGVEDSLSLWNYADNFDSTLTIADGDWLTSNSQEVLDRTLAVTSSVSHQFKGQFSFTVDKELPMPAYSVPGMDII